MTNKNKKTLKSLKTKLKKLLPEQIMKVMNSYENFLEQNIPDDAKGFSTYHGAGKAAVAHIETLLKLAKWSEEDTELGSVKEGFDIKELIREARFEVLDGDDED